MGYPHHSRVTLTNAMIVGFRLREIATEVILPGPDPELRQEVSHLVGVKISSGRCPGTIRPVPLYQVDLPRLLVMPTILATETWILPLNVIGDGLKALPGLQAVLRTILAILPGLLTASLATAFPQVRRVVALSVLQLAVVQEDQTTHPEDNATCWWSCQLGLSTDAFLSSIFSLSCLILLITGTAYTNDQGAISMLA